MKKEMNNPKRKPIESNKPTVEDSSVLNKMFGEWQDDKDSDAIIKQIRESRVNSRQMEEFE